jgi:hypothetical protein
MGMDGVCIFRYRASDSLLVVRNSKYHVLILAQLVVYVWGSLFRNCVTLIGTFCNACVVNDVARRVNVITCTQRD